MMVKLTIIFSSITNVQDFTVFASVDYEATTTFITIVGSVILCVSSVGIYGVFNDINIIIYAYTCFMFFIVTAELAASVSSLILRYKK